MYKGHPKLIQLHLYTKLFSKDFSSLFRTNAVDLLAEFVVTIEKYSINAVKLTRSMDADWF